MRDGAARKTITIDPKTVDLMWELHADLGSRAPIHIICGYRSPKTNAFLKRVGRNVAKRASTWLAGPSIFISPTWPPRRFEQCARQKSRRRWLLPQLRRTTGFVHIDSGNVRHWGPAIGKTEMAQIFP